MRPQLWDEAAALFDQLCDAGAEARRRRLAEIAGTRPELATAAERLLAADGGASLLDEEVAAGLTAAFADLLEPAGEPSAPELEPVEAGGRVGPWRLLERVGAGGMGEVWLAERADGGFAQRAAVKLLKRGLDTDLVLARFQRERAILARLQHPGIARLLDGGTSADGCPYFALEHIVGQPLTEYAAARGLTVEARLELVRSVCDAVEYAHRNLVVHRDLKPSNILVTAEGEPKLLDFGIAKLLADEEDARLTHTGLKVLTPAYAAPEQAAGKPVTTATDVYGLGVVLYELLTGELPRGRDGDTPAGVGAAAGASAPRPSVAVRATASSAGQADGPRRERLARRLAGDLDTIVLRAMASEPERRYGSAAALAEDLRRHVAGLPILARPESLRYRAGKFVRRNRAAVLVAGLAGAALLAMLVTSIAQARAARTQARLARQEAARADAQARRAERVKELLVALFRQSDPGESRGAAITAREILEAGTRRIETELAQEPEVRAELQATLAGIYEHLGLYEPARFLAESSVALRRRLYPEGDPRVGVGLAVLGSVLMQSERHEEARDVLEAAIRALERSAEREERLALAWAQSDLAHLETFADPRAGLALQEAAYQGFLELLGADHSESLTALHHLALAREDAGEYAAAEPAYRAAIAGLERLHDARHPDVAHARAHYAGLLDRLGRREEAAVEFERALAIEREALGPRHDKLAHTLFSYGIFLNGARRYEEALAAFTEAQEIFGPDVYSTGHCLRYSGLSLLGLERPAEAAERLTAAAELYRRTLGADHGEVHRAVADVGTARRRMGDLEAAERLQRDGIAGIERAYGAEAYQLAKPLGELGETLRLRGELPEAIAVHRRGLELTRQVLGPRHARSALAARELALDLLEREAPGDVAEAETLLTEASGILRESAPDEPLRADIEARLERLATAREVAAD
jgi:serine/threonine-protein kinase